MKRSDKSRMRWIGAVTAAALTGCFTIEPLQPTPGRGDGGGAGGSGGSTGEGGGDGGSDGGLLPACQGGRTSACARVERAWAGRTFTCAGFDDDTVRCVGFNDSGQLGDPTVPPQTFARGVVEGIGRPATMTLGWAHGCATIVGALHCWGRNTTGQLGDGTTTFAPVPTPVLVDAPVDAVSAMNSSTCALHGGAVSCWGHAMNGQSWPGLDQGDFEPMPTEVGGLEQVVAIGVGLLHGCAIEADDEVRCWGYGGDGALGDGTLDSSLDAVPVAPAPPAPVRHLAVGIAHACVEAGDPSTVWCWGVQPDPESLTLSPTPLPTQPDGVLVEMQAGAGHTCARLEDGRVQCWGRNTRAQLGTGGPTTDVPGDVIGLVDAVALAVGGEHSCAVRASGQLVCWGDNRWGQLGRMADDGTATPGVIAW